MRRAAEGAGHAIIKGAHAVRAAVVDVVDAVGVLPAEEQQGAGRVAGMDDGHGKGALPAGQGGDAAPEALKDGQQAAIPGAVDDGRAQGHEAISRRPAKDLLHQQF